MKDTCLGVPTDTFTTTACNVGNHESVKVSLKFNLLIYWLKILICLLISLNRLAVTSYSYWQRTQSWWFFFFWNIFLCSLNGSRNCLTIETNAFIYFFFLQFLTSWLLVRRNSRAVGKKNIGIYNIYNKHN